jgi:eukaryotic-like serine/threonine-protein kinase
MICPNCHNENREGARFCDACGTPLATKIDQVDSDTPAADTTANELVISESDETKSDIAVSSVEGDEDEKPTTDGSASGKTMQIPAILNSVPEVEGAPSSVPQNDSESKDKADADKGNPELTLDFSQITARISDVSSKNGEGSDERLADGFAAPKPNWRDGGTMEMPKIEGASTEQSKDFRASSTKKQKHTGRNIAIAVILVAIIAGGIGAFITYQMELWGGKTVPDISGMTQQEATDALEALGFSVRTTQVKSDDTEGLVLVEDPEAKSRAEEGSEIIIHVSVSRKMPDIVGKSQSEAKTLLDSEGLTNVTYTMVSSDEAEGTVLEASIDAGKTIKSTTALEVKVAQAYTVPDIANMSLSEAQQAISDAGLSSQVYYTYSEQYYDGTILGTTPSAGEKVKSDDVITINVTRTRSTELIAATRSLIYAGGTVQVNGISYAITSLDSVSYSGNNQTSFTMTASPYISLLGERLQGSSRTISGTITWNDDNSVSSIS